VGIPFGIPSVLLSQLMAIAHSIQQNPAPFSKKENQDKRGNQDKKQVTVQEC